MKLFGGRRDFLLLGNGDEITQLPDIYENALLSVIPLRYDT